MTKRFNTVVEVDPFRERASKLFTDDERLEFITYIGQNSLAGVVIPSRGGIRKIRWTRLGSGKRGGVRVLYYFLDEMEQVFLLTMFAKNQQADLSPPELKLLKKMVTIIRSESSRVLAKFGISELG